MVRHLDHEKGQPCDICDTAAVAKSQKAPSKGFFSPSNQELVRDDGRVVVTRIKGTNITITRRKG